MAKIPVVSIVGRPNVGKSCLLNRIVGRRVAVVDDQPGVTRDRNYQPASWDGRAFLAVDTGGLLPNSTESIPRHIAAQVDLAVKESSAIIFVVEAGVGPTELDLQVARILRRVAKDRLLLAVNKCEAESRQLDVHQYMALGCGEAHPISALHGLGIGDLLDKVAAKLDEHGASRGRDDQPSLRIAVVGRPNAGKSSLVNRLLGEERMIVDNVPGTTRDAIDSELRFHNRTISLIDTAGLRRKAQVKDDVEYYCNLRALESIKRCDVAVLLIDSSEALGEQDLKIVQQIHQHRRGLVVCWNKWDLAPKDSSTFDGVASQTRQLYPEMRHVPMLAISALTGQRVGKVVEAAVEVHDRMTRRIPHTELEDNAIGWARVYPHPVIQSKNVRLLGFKQRPASFPLFSCFVTNAKVALPMYNRFLENKMHDTYGFEGCPIIIEFRNVSRPTGRQAGKRAGK